MFAGGGGGRGGAVSEPDGTVGAWDEGQGDQSHAVSPGSTGEAGQLVVAKGQQLLQTPFLQTFYIEIFCVNFFMQQSCHDFIFWIFLLTGILLFIFWNKKKKKNK